MSSCVFCIYCSERILDPTAGEGDHVIPAALGRFQGEFTFRRICAQCNSRIGEAEEQLIRCAPEALFRHFARPALKRRKRGMSWVGSHGLPAPTFMVRHSDHHELADPMPGQPDISVAVDQLVVLKENKEEHHIRLFPEMTAQSLQAKISPLNVSKADKCYLHADEQTFPIFKNLLEQALPGYKLTEQKLREAGMHRVECRMQFHITDMYWQSIAKIALHYYLVHSKRGLRGDEPEFDAIRSFISHGGDIDQFFIGNASRFKLPFQELPGLGAILPTHWAHFLAADESERAIVVAVALFAGPRRLPKLYHVQLAELTSPIIVSGACYGHVYLYDSVANRNAPTKAEYAGRVEELSLTRIK